jgi:sucrose phosphorylase
VATTIGPAVAGRPQLLTYPDSLGGDLPALASWLDGPLAGHFRGVHILPPFPSSGDRGFAPLSYREIDRRFGDWADIRRIAGKHDVLLDLMINHLSRQSPEFRDFERRGRRSPAAELFITLDKVWPGGMPPADDIARFFLRKPDAPFSTITIEETGETERIWTSFGSTEWSEQIDLDVTSTATRTLITDWLRFFADGGVRIVRLDAVGYVIKKRGTSCFMVEPEIYDFLEWVTRVATAAGLAVLPEVHDRYQTHERLASHGFWTYDFVLPGLVLNAFETGRSERLASHLARSPVRQFTTLDCHDGIPVRPDLDGILEPAEMVATSTGCCPPRTGPKSTSTSSTARTTRRSAATTSVTSRLARFSCSHGASPRSITWGC